MKGPGINWMNGEALCFQSFGDFNEPGRRNEIARHTSHETGERMLRRTSRGGVSAYGWVWIEALEDAGHLNPKPLLHEVILKSQKRWDAARIRALAESGRPNPVISFAPCCRNAGKWLVRHQWTTRHFRYWCLDMQIRAVGNWPWLREVIAEEVLSGVME